jgi:hypothetical protein
VVPASLPHGGLPVSLPPAERIRGKGASKMPELTQVLEPQVKGAALLSIFRFLKSQAEGEVVLQRVLNALPAEARSACRRRVIAVGDYPYPLYVSFIRGVDRILGQGDLKFCRKLGEYVAGHDIPLIYKQYQKQPKPEDLIPFGNLFWKSHLNVGAMNVEDASPEHSVIRIYDFPAMDRAHCRLIEGWIAQALIEAGGVWIEELHEVRCNSKGDPYHEFFGRWKLPATAELGKKENRG